METADPTVQRPNDKTMETTTTNEKCIDVCNELLRGELSAVETYDIAIRKFDGAAEMSKLSEIRADHQVSANRLRQNVQDMGGMPSTDSGAWGTFASAVEKAASFFGENSALAALEEGEKHGIHDYESALANDDVMAECKQMISEELLPRLHSHLTSLDHLKG